MESNKFDRFSRVLARRSSRRQMTRIVGAGGVGMLVSSRVGLDRAAAQIAESVCRIEVNAAVVVGNDPGRDWSGEIELRMRSDGSIESGVLHAQGGNAIEVVGEQLGHSLSLRAGAGGDAPTVFAGIGRMPIEQCAGAVDGTFADTKSGELGIWTGRFIGRASEDSKPAGEGAIVATPAGTALGSACGEPLSCPDEWMWDEAACACVCQFGLAECGDTCCPEGTICGASGECVCRTPGDERCGGECFSPCTGITFRNPETCNCEDPCAGYSCAPGQELRRSNGQCVCQDLCEEAMGPSWVFCNDMCLDSLTFPSDPNNCGSCGNVCPQNAVCRYAECECQEGHIWCQNFGACIPGDSC